MNARIGILVIAFGVVPLALAPALIISQPADAATHWCEGSP